MIKRPLVLIGNYLVRAEETKAYEILAGNGFIIVKVVRFRVVGAGFSRGRDNRGTVAESFGFAGGHCWMMYLYYI